MSDDSDPVFKWLADVSKKMLASPKKGSKLIEQALIAWPSLLPKVEEYTFPNGTRQSLLNLYGTIPVVFRDSSFNIPISIWFTRDFPKKPPHFYVAPTPDMVLKTSSNVKKGGLLTTSYTEQWEENEKNMDLYTLINQAIAIFSQQPPVFARPPGYVSESDNESDTNESTPPDPPSLEQTSKPNKSEPSVNPTSSSATSTAFSSAADSDEKLTSSNYDILKAIESIKIANEAKSKQSNAERPDPGSVYIEPTKQSNTSVPQKPFSEPTSTKKPLLFNNYPGRPPIPTGSNTPKNTSESSFANSSSSNLQDNFASSSLNSKHTAIENEANQVTTFKTANPVKQTVAQPKLPPSLALPQPPPHASNIHKNDNFVNAMANEILAVSKLQPLPQIPAQNFGTNISSSLQTSLLDSEIPDDDEKRLMGYKVAMVEKLGESMYEFRELHSKLNHNLLKDCSELHSGAAIASLEEKELQNLNKNLDKNIAILNASLNTLKKNKDTLTETLLKIKNENPEQLEPENLFVGVDALSEQCIKVSSEIHAIEDSFYYMGKILDNDQIDLSTYLKHVRKLAQKLFFAKALQSKILNSLNRN